MKGAVWSSKDHTAFPVKRITPDMQVRAKKVNLSVENNQYGLLQSGSRREETTCLYYEIINTKGIMIIRYHDALLNVISLWSVATAR